MPNLRRPFAGLESVDFTGLRMRFIDADQQIIGRLASYLSIILQGKDKPIFAPNKDYGDICVVVNAEKAVFTGNKWEGKVYKWHTGYPGGLKEITAKELWRRDPTELLRRAVYGMLPSNKLRDDRMRKLRVFPGPEHAFKGVELVPWTMPPRKVRDRGLGWLIPEGFEPLNPVAYARRMRGSRLLAAQQFPKLAIAGDVPLIRQSTAAGAAAKAGQAVSFDDLLTAEEQAFISSRQNS
eukprot:gene10284-10443_t